MRPELNCILRQKTQHKLAENPNYFHATVASIKKKTAAAFYNIDLWNDENTAIIYSFLSGGDAFINEWFCNNPMAPS